MVEDGSVDVADHRRDRGHVVVVIEGDPKVEELRDGLNLDPERRRPASACSAPWRLSYCIKTSEGCGAFIVDGIRRRKVHHRAGGEFPEQRPGEENPAGSSPHRRKTSRLSVRCCRRLARQRGEQRDRRPGSRCRGRGRGGRGPRIPVSVAQVGLQPLPLNVELTERDPLGSQAIGCSSVKFRCWSLWRLRFSGNRLDCWDWCSAQGADQQTGCSGINPLVVLVAGPIFLDCLLGRQGQGRIERPKTSFLAIEAAEDGSGS